MWAQNKDFGAGLHTDFIRSLVLSVLQAICVSSINFFWFYLFAYSHLLPKKGIYHPCKVAFRKVEGAGLEAKYSKKHVLTGTSC